MMHTPRRRSVGRLWSRTPRGEQRNASLEHGRADEREQGMAGVMELGDGQGSDIPERLPAGQFYGALAAAMLGGLAPCEARTRSKKT